MDSSRLNLQSDYEWMNKNVVKWEASSDLFGKSNLKCDGGIGRSSREYCGLQPDDMHLQCTTNYVLLIGCFECEEEHFFS